MTVLVNAIRQRIDIEIIDIDVLIQRLKQIGSFIYPPIAFALNFSLKLIGQMILTIIATTWFVLWVAGAVLSNLH